MNPPFNQLFRKILSLTITAALGLLIFQVSNDYIIPQTHAQSSNQVYVATTGNDTTGDGSLNNPYGTLPKAIAVVNAGTGGQTIFLRGGTYDVSGAWANRIKAPDVTIESYPGEWAHVEAPLDTTASLVTIWIDSTAHRFKLINVEVSGGYYSVEFWHGSSRTDVPGGVGTEILGCKLHDSYGDAIKLVSGTGSTWDSLLPAASDVLIENNEIYGLGHSTNDQGVDNVMGDRMTVRNNYIHDFNDAGIIIKGGARDATIEDNLLVNLAVGVVAGQDTGEDFFDHVNNPHTYEAIHHIVRNNIVVNTVYAGIQTWASLNTEIYNNTLVNVANTGQGGIYIVGHQHYDWSAGDGTHTTIDVTCDGLQVRNNIVELASSSSRFGTYVSDLGYAAGLPPIFSNNLYYQAGKNVQFYDVARWPTTSYVGGFAGWQAEIGSETGTILTDPLLDINNNYRLLAGSPATNSGISLIDVAGDYENNLRPIGSGYDIGAYEYNPQEPFTSAHINIIKYPSSYASATGALITYTISYTNIGQGGATNVKLSDSIPTGTTYVTGSASDSGVLNGTTIEWDIGNIPADDSGSVLFKVTIN